MLTNQEGNFCTEE